jgi:hypothetical protein
MSLPGLPIGFSNFATGQVTATGSAQQMPPSLASSIIVKALKGNDAAIYLGTSAGVTTDNGFQLEPGDSVELAIADLNMIWLIGTADDVLSWMAMY